MWDDWMDLFGSSDLDEWLPSDEFSWTSDLDDWIPPIEGADGLDWSFPTGGGSDILSAIQNAGKGAGSLFGGGGSNPLSSLFGGSGGMDLMSLLGLLGMGAGALNANHATNQASQQLQDAANKANDFATTTIGGARDDFKPYQSAGTDALSGIQALLASQADKPKFTPLKSRQMAPMKGSMTLAQLAAR